MKKLLLLIIAMLLATSVVAADYTISPAHEEACWSGGGYMNSNTYDNNEATGDSSKNYTYGGCETNYNPLTPDNFASATGLKLRFLIDYKTPSENSNLSEAGYINVGCGDTLIFDYQRFSIVEPKPVIIGDQDLPKQWYEVDITNECLEQVKNDDGWKIGFEWQGSKFANTYSQGIFTIYEHELLVEERTIQTTTTKSRSSGGSSLGGGSSNRYYINDKGQIVNENEEQKQTTETTPTPAKKTVLQKIQEFDTTEWFKTIGPKIKGWLIK